MHKRNRRPAFRRDQSGYMLVELITAGTLTALLVGLFGYIVVNATSQQPEIATRAAQVQEGRYVVERLAREVREGYGVTTATANQLSFITFVRNSACGGSTPLASSVPAIPCRVTYGCASGECTRTEANPDGSGAGAAVRVVSGLSSDSVFSYEPPTGTPLHVTATLTFPRRDNRSPVPISDGAEFRNG